MIRVPSAAARRARCRCSARPKYFPSFAAGDVFSTSQPTSNQQKQNNNSNNNNGGLFGENCTAGALPRDQRKSFPFIRYSIYRDEGYILHKRYPGEREKVPGAICMDYKATQSLSLNLLTAQQRGAEEEEEGAHTISNWIQISWQRTTSWINVTRMEIVFFLFFFCFKWFGTKADLRLELLTRCRVWAQIKSKLIWG